MSVFFKQFKGLLITLGIMIVIFILLYNCHGSVSSSILRKEDDNSTTNTRVFDYGNVLTKEQERSLEELIEKRRAQTGLDIVLVTLNEDLDDWYDDNIDLIKEHGYDGAYYEQNIDDDICYKSICVYANVFYDEHKFGYEGYDENEYYSGDGVIFVDNWYDDLTWLGTSGRVIDEYEDDWAAKSWHLLDLVGDSYYISPYFAYKVYIDTIYFDQVGMLGFNTYVSPFALIFFAFIIALIWMWIKGNSLKTKDTTRPETYVNGSPMLNVNQDIFLRKYVTQHHISSSSGYHGGGSHGGGGHGGGHGHGGHGGGH